MEKISDHKKLLNAPLSLVVLNIIFENDLTVLEKRSQYFNLIKERYPQINIPKIANLQYDLGDCDFFTNDFSYKVGVAINNFSFATIKYHTYADFFARVKDAWDKFQNVYGERTIKVLSLSYENNINQSDVTGKDFSDYFTIKYDFPGKAEKKFKASEGSFFFSTDNAILRLDFRPTIGEGKTEADYKFAIEYRENMLGGDLEKWLNKAHETIEDVFLNSITDKYKNTIA